MTYPPNTPAQLVALGSKVVMTELLGVKIMDFECRMCYRALLSRGSTLEEERVVIRVPLLAIDMEETGDGSLVFIDNI